MLLVCSNCLYAFSKMITLLKFFPKHKLRKLRFEFLHKLLSCLSLAILSNYLTWGICVSRPPSLALALALAPGPNLYLTALAPNLYLPTPALNLYLPTLSPQFVPALANIGN